MSNYYSNNTHVNIKWKILEKNENEQAIIVRYWTDMVSQEDLRNASENLPDGTPVRCVTDYNINIWHHLESEEEKNHHTAGNKTMFNLREAQVKKKKKTRGNPFRVLMGKVGKLLDHGLEKKDIVRYLAKQKFWTNETIERAVDIVRDYNKKKKQDSDDDKDVKEEKKASAINNIKTAGLDYSEEPDFEKRSTSELLFRAYYLEELMDYDKNTPQGSGKDAASKEGASAELKKIKTELKKRGESLEDLDLG